MITICLSVAPAPFVDRGWRVDILPKATERQYRNPLLRAMQAPMEPQWTPLPRRFVCKRYALVAMRRAIRTGAATEAKLYWGGSLHAHWTRDPKTGRELKTHIADTA